MVISVSCVSGGKTSAYMAVHFPTDRYIFSCVLTNDPATVIQDKSLRNYCKEKLQWFDWDKGGSREVDLTLHALRELEQLLGKEIEWVSAPFTYDQLINGKIDPVIKKCYDAGGGMLPNRRARICTTSLKIYPVAWRLYLTTEDPPLMHIGFRRDEEKRVFNTKCDRDNIELALHCDLIGKYKNKHRRTKVWYQTAVYPLYNEGVCKHHVEQFWRRKGWKFPEISNCDFCFFNSGKNLARQYELYPERFMWWYKMEQETGKQFDDNGSILDRMIFGLDSKGEKCSGCTD